MPKKIDEEKVFHAAIEVLVAVGYENATTKKIAEAADIHEATLFRKYGSKFDLIERAIQQRLSDTPLSQLVYSGDLRQDLLAILRAYIEVNRMHGEIVPLLFLEAGRNPELRKLFQIPWTNLRFILGILETYQARGELVAENVLTTLNVLIGPIMLNNMVEKASMELSIPAIDLELYVDAFLHGRSLSMRQD